MAPALAAVDRPSLARVMTLYLACVLAVSVAFKINQAPPQGIKEPRLPVSGILAGKVRVDQADGGGTFAHRCCHPFD